MIVHRLVARLHPFGVFLRVGVLVGDADSELLVALGYGVLRLLLPSAGGGRHHVDTVAIHKVVVLCLADEGGHRFIIRILCGEESPDEASVLIEVAADVAVQGDGRMDYVLGVGIDVVVLEDGLVVRLHGSNLLGYRHVLAEAVGDIDVGAA